MTTTKASSSAACLTVVGRPTHRAYGNVRELIFGTLHVRISVDATVPDGLISVCAELAHNGQWQALSCTVLMNDAAPGKSSQPQKHAGQPASAAPKPIGTPLTGGSPFARAASATVHHMPRPAKAGAPKGLTPASPPPNPPAPAPAVKFDPDDPLLDIPF